MINNEREAMEALDGILDWIGRTASEEARPRQAGFWEPRVAGLARDMCRAILSEAMAEGLSGCPLCQG